MVAVLLHASFAVNVLVCERRQLLLVTALSLNVTDGVPQPSVAVAVPSDASTSADDGLHPSDVDVPPVVSTSGVKSSIQLTVLDAVDVLPQ